MNILLTGATGFIGRTLVPQLLAAGHELSVLVRRSGPLQTLSWQSRVRVFEGDLGVPESLGPACQGQMLVIHLAALAHITNTPDEAHWQTGCQGTRHLLEAAISAGVQRFLFVSSIKASSDPTASAYARAKAASEALLLEAHRSGSVQVSIVRPAVVYGPGMKGNLLGWIRLLQKGLVPPLPPNAATLQMIGVEDLGRALCQLAQSDAGWGRTLVLDDGRRYPLKQVEAGIRNCLGRSSPHWYLPRPFWRLAAVSGDLCWRLLKLNAGFNSRSYQTLFVSDKLLEDPEARPDGFVAQQDFYGALPAIVAELQHKAPDKA